MNDCRDVRDNLSAWIDGELPAAELLAVERHLVACPDCRAEADDLRRVQLAVTKMPLPFLPRDMVVDINRAIDADELVARRPVKPAWRRPAVMGSLAAAAMVVMMLTYTLPWLLVDKLSPALDREQAPAPAGVVPDRTGAPVANAGRGSGQLTVELPVPEPAPVHQEEVAVAVNAPSAVNREGAPAALPAAAPAPVPAVARPVVPAPAPAADALPKSTYNATDGARAAVADEGASRLAAPMAVAPVSSPPGPSAMAEGNVVMSAPAPGAAVRSALLANQARGVNIGGNSVTAIMPVLSLKRLRSHVAPRMVSTSTVAGDSESVRVTIPIVP